MTETIRDEQQAPPTFAVDAVEFARIVYDLNEATWPHAEWDADAIAMHISAIEHLRRDMILAGQRLIALAGYRTLAELHEAAGDIN